MIILAWGCANPVAPEGGPKDSKPPRVLSSQPPSFSVNFKENTIKIDFDEFITLKNTASEVSVSPPLKTMPDIKVRGKGLVVKIDDTLAANTTYFIDFGKSITDITEGNALAGFSYVFSTGPFIDSLSLRGSVINAFDLTPPKDVVAMLYIDCNDTVPFDSLPFKVKPYYVTKVNEKGEFIFRNLKPAAMKLTALADLNGSLTFDQPTEKVAFSDSVVHPYYIPVPKKDSSAAKADTAAKAEDPSKQKKSGLSPAGEKFKARQDSLKKDSAFMQMPIPFNRMFLFEDMDSVQRILKSAVVKKGLVLICFRFPVKDLRLQALNLDTAGRWAFEESTRGLDSLYLWMNYPMKDSLILKVSQGEKVIDTLELELNSKDNKAEARKKDQGKVFLGVYNNSGGAGFNQFAGQFTLTFSYPLVSADFSRIRLKQDKDSLQPKVYFADSLKRIIVVENKWKEDKNYTLFVPDSAFIAINGLANDTIRYSFKSRLQRDFGNIIMDIDISKRPGDYIIQLLNERNAVIGEKRINSSGKVKFEYLTPGKFTVKAIKDRNNNGRWDTGNFRKKIQPEEVFFLPKTIELRANWDVEEKWSPLPAY